MSSPRFVTLLVGAVCVSLIPIELGLGCKAGGARLTCLCSEGVRAGPAHARQRCRRAPGAPFGEQPLFATLIDHAYGGGARREIFDASARVLLDVNTVAGLPVADSISIASRLRDMIGAASADGLVAAFGRANRTSTATRALLQEDARHFFLDSAELRRFLREGRSALPQLGRGANDNVMSVSKPGYADSGLRALVFGMLRSPSSSRLDHIVAASYVLFEYDDMRWQIRAEVPATVGGAR